MILHLGNVPAGSTVYVPFNTFNSSGASVTITGLAVTDIEIYKNGSVTQRASDNGYTLLDTDGIDFDGITGLHGFKIDLSDNSDSGFYAAGNHYMVAVSTITADSQTVSFWAASFWIGPQESNAIQISGDATAADNLEATFDGTGYTNGNAPATQTAVAALPTANANADALLDRTAGVETNLTVRQWARLVASVQLGKASGGGTGTETFRDTNDTKDRVISTNDANGNRTAVTLDAS